MTRRDYTLIADTIRNLRIDGKAIDPDAARDIAKQFAFALKHAAANGTLSPKSAGFDADRFVLSCTPVPSCITKHLNF